MTATDIINISKVSEVLTGNPTYLRKKGDKIAAPEKYQYAIESLLSQVDEWLLRHNK